MLMPSQQIRDQVFHQFLTDVGEKMGLDSDNLHFFDIYRNEISDLMDIHEQSKVFIISEDEEWIGVNGIELIEKEKYKQDENRHKSNKAFVEACENWILNLNLIKERSDDNDTLRKNKAIHYKLKKKELPPIGSKNLEEHVIWD